jgi:methylase of polypeptide subunit release factors
MRLRGINGTFFVSTRLEVHFRIHDDDKHAGDDDDDDDDDEPDSDRSAGPPSNKRRRLDQVAKECPLQVVSASCEFPRLFSVLNNERIRWEKAEEEKRKRRILRISVSELDSASKKSGLRLVWDENKQGVSAGAFAESGAKYELVSTKTVSAEESPNSASFQTNLQGDSLQSDCYSEEGYFCGKLVCNQNAPSLGASNATGSTSIPFLSAQETYHLHQAATKVEEKDSQNGELTVEDFGEDGGKRGRKEGGKGIEVEEGEVEEVETKEIEIEEVKFCNRNFITASGITMAPKRGSEVVVRAAVEVLEKWGNGNLQNETRNAGGITKRITEASSSSKTENNNIGEVTGESTSTRATQVVDLGCGSGCLLLSVAWESTNESRSVIQNASEGISDVQISEGQNRVDYHGIDISADALEISKLNRIRLKRFSRFSQDADQNVNLNCVGVPCGSNDNKNGSNVNNSSNNAHTVDDKNVNFHLGTFKNFAGVIEGSTTNHSNNKSSSLGRNNTNRNNTNDNQNLLVLCNPPYLTPGDYKSTVNEGSVDPGLAMIGTEKDGLGAYREVKKSVLGIKTAREIRSNHSAANQGNHAEFVIIFEVPARKVAQVIELMSPEFAVSGRFSDDYGQQRCVSFKVADAIYVDRGDRI